ncbi:MAG: TonB C-terminal domain-containing protein [Deltaproteobacteria bacterium]|jgi:outer membrane biosynthesis protein TonB|nr:TonB C-terminal domain-containing protein [Deltaproteobacteria bacterium]
MARTQYFNRYAPEATAERLGFVLLLSLGFHVLFFGWLILAPQFLDFGGPKELPFEALTVELVGGLEAPAPAAPPAPVDEKLDLPDVIDLPSADPILPQPTPLEKMITPPTPTEVIPIGQRPPEAPAPPTKRQDPPPKVQIPEKPPEPKPVKKEPAVVNPKKTTQSAVENLRRKTEAEKAEREMQSSVANLAKARGQGDGNSSDNSTGRTDGVQIDPVKAYYYSQVKEIVRSNWVAPISAFGASANLGAVYVVVIEPNGRVSGRNLRRYSGDPEFDASIEQAILRSNFPPLPPVFEDKADNPALRFELSYLNRNG